MANVLAELFQNTANAIREKTGETGKIKPLEFPEKIRSIQMGTGGTEPNLIPLSVTENGNYYPTLSIEHGKTYTFKNSYTQVELKAFYEAALGKSDDGMYAYLCANLENGNSQKMLGVIYAYGYYGLYISDGHKWLPEEFASAFGLASGWNFGADIPDLKPSETPSFSFETYEVLISGGLPALNPLFDLPTVDGFSEVTVAVPERVPVLEELEITENGVYEPSNADGYSKVTVEVPQETAEMNLIPLSVTENGVYEPSDADGYSKVTVNIKGGSVTGAHTLTFLNHDGSLLYEKQTVDGDDSYDPIEAGKIEIPTKESNVQYHYTYNGWSLTNGGSPRNDIFLNITEDKTIYASFEQTDRLYVARFWDGDDLMEEKYVPYGGTALTPHVPPKDGYTFLGWDTDDFTIYGDRDFYSRWEELSGWVILEKDPNFTSGNLSGIAYNNSGTRLAVFDYTNQKMIVYDSTSYPYQNLFEIEYTDVTNTVSLLCYSSDDQTLYACIGRYEYSYDTSTVPYTLIKSLSFSTKNSPRSANCIPNDDGFIVTNNKVTEDGNTRHYNRNLGRVCTYGYLRYGIYPNSSTADVTGTKIASAYYKTGNTDTIAVYSLDGVRDSACPTLGMDNGMCCTFDPTGRYLLFLTTSSTKLRCYDTSTNPYTEVDIEEIAGEALHTYNTETYFYTSPKKEYLLMRDSENRIQVYDMRTIPFRHIQDFPEISGPMEVVTITPDLKKVMILKKKNSADYIIVSNV